MTEHDLVSKEPMHSLRIALVVLFLLLLVSSWANWYSGQVSMPRYCENTQETMQYLERFLLEPKPDGKTGNLIPSLPNCCFCSRASLMRIFRLICAGWNPISSFNANDTQP